MKQSIVLKNTNDVSDLVATLAVAGYKVWVEYFIENYLQKARVFYEEVLPADTMLTGRMEVQP